MLLAFAEKNPGMVRVMTGDALVGEHERLQVRMNQFFDRFEATLKQALRVASDGDAAGRAGDAAALLDRLPAPVREKRLRQEAERELHRPAALPAGLKMGSDPLPKR